MTTVPKLSPSDETTIERICVLVSKLTGVQLGQKQRPMVTSRLTKRMLELGIDNIDEYIRFMQDNAESETTMLVSLLTTHHTYFFREFAHFEYLEGALPEIVQAARIDGRKNIHVWSAACSRGQEVYSLAMFLKRHLQIIAPDFDFEILGTDIDPNSIATAKNGVYAWKEIKEVPAAFLRGNWDQGTGDISDFARVSRSLRSRCHFETSNLFDETNIASGRRFDIIFCRNVFIYFNADQIQKITENISARLNKNGVLFIGLSESLMGIRSSLKHAGPSTYRHRNAEAPQRKVIPLAAHRPIRVLCVDDSKTVLTLLRKILASEAGFEVVGVAANGIEAAAFLKKNQVDVVTLDLHMPGQDGVEYLEKNFSPSHPPVVVVSSVSREDQSLALKARTLGAIDYIEKPTMTKLEKCSEELRTKLRFAATTKGAADNTISEIEKSFQAPKNIGAPQDAVCIFVVKHPDGLEKIKATAKSMKNSPLPILVLVEGSESDFTKFHGNLRVTAPDTQNLESLAVRPRPGTLYVGKFSSLFRQVKTAYPAARASIAVLDTPDVGTIREIVDWDGAFILLEEVSEASAAGFAYRSLLKKACFVAPFSSLLHHGIDHLVRKPNEK